MSRFTLFPLENNGLLNFGGNQETHNFAVSYHGTLTSNRTFCIFKIMFKAEKN